LIAISEEGDSVILNMRIQPRSAKNEVIGIHGNALKIRLTSPPVEGKANEQCISFVANLFHVNRSSIELVSGKKGRDKRIRISGFTKEQIITFLESNGYV